MILSTVIQDLRAAFPGAQITLFIGTANAQMGQLIEGITNKHYP